MLVKFIPTGTTKKGRTGRTGGGQDAQNYLLGKDFEKGIVRDGATLLRGNPSRTTKIINGIKNQNAYKSGVISFSKDEKPTPEQLESVMDGLENTLFPNLDKDRYSCYWVHHQDKDRDELHFIIAEIDLQTNKSLAVYYAPNDKKLIESWAKLTIEQHGFIDPSDPLHKRTKTQTTRNEKDNEQKDIIEKRLLAVIEKDESIKTRDDIIEVIKDLGYEINRSTAPDSISIKNPDGKRPLKFKDGIYTKDFDRSQLPSHRKQAKIQYDKDHDNRIAKYKKQYEYSLALREKRLEKRIGTLDRTTDPKLSAKLDQIRAESEPNFLKQVAEYQRQELKKIIGQTIEQIYKQHEHDQPEKIAMLKNLHETLIDSIDSQVKDEPLPKFDEVIANYQNSKNHILTFDSIEYDRRQAELARQQAEQQRLQQEQFERALTEQSENLYCGETLPESEHQKLAELDDATLEYNKNHYLDEMIVLVEKSESELLTQAEIADFRAFERIVNSIHIIEQDRLEQQRELAQEQAQTADTAPELVERSDDEFAQPTPTPPTATDLDQPEPEITLNQRQQIVYDIASKYYDVDLADFAEMTDKDLREFENPYQSDHKKYLSLVHGYAQSLKDKELDTLKQQFEQLQQSAPVEPTKGFMQSEKSFTKQWNEFIENQRVPYNRAVSDMRNKIDKLHNFGRLDNYLNQKHYDVINQRYPQLAQQSLEYKEFQRFVDEVNYALSQYDRQQRQPQVEQVKTTSKGMDK